MVERAEVLAGIPDVDLTGATALVTGATSGVGREVALALGRLGARVLVHGRDPERGRAVTEALRNDGAEPVLFRADFTDQSTVRGLADAVRQHTDDLDVLVNNAGAHYQGGWLTEDGVEATFAVNHLAPFLLTNLLKELLDGGRVVTVASAVHERAGRADLTRKAVTTVSDYDGLDAYGRSKLANVLFTREFARRFDTPTATCCHPGVVPGSGLWRNASLPVKTGVRVLDRLPQVLVGRFVDTPAQAAATPVYLAASPDVADADGEYFSDCEPVEPSRAALDDDLARRVWELSADVVGLA